MRPGSTLQHYHHSRTGASAARLFFLLLLLTVGCGLQRSYEGQGRIVGFGDDGRTVIIEHEDIPRLMPAMTMPFQVQDSTELTSFAQGDALRFTLHLSRDSSWIADLIPLPDSAVARHPAGAPDAFLDATATPLLEPGDAVPVATLVNQAGETINLADFQGRALLLTFIYTRCPLPDFCPLLSRQFQRLQPVLANRFGDEVHLLSISFDPAYDTPATLRDYARRYTQNTSTWSFTTGSEEAIADLASRFGVFFAANGDTFDHNLTTALIDQEGRVVHLWRGNDWQTEDVLAAVSDLIAD
ncbi:MAG TPA: SCO family protein [Rhodothermales bacterium]|nr:SCO family protein [Rhodothermales bacterium]